MNRLVLHLLFILILSPAYALAKDISIVASIKPLQFIAYEITDGVTTPDLLVASTASPHDYALRPSDVKKIARADLVIWFGPELEPFMQGIMKGKKQSLRLGAEDSLSVHEYGDGHIDDGHNHGSHDPHIWLGPLQARQAAKIIADRLALIDPEHQVQYQSNFAKFESNLDSVTSEIEAKLAPVRDKGYYVFHDAYGYFEEYFSLNKLGQFTVSPERKPGAKTLIKIKMALRAGEASCVFSEPQFKSSIIESVTRGSNVGQGELDPLGLNIKVQKSAYFDFLNSLADSYTECLTAN
ncbi:zinc ABC transporter substrate-binding protein [Vibrio sp. JC009]|uniref:zinc ABC transporter substrate-binding protein n=1 Tax=Vibrio sp. JC009 TaxID=2912314 RepID=UPI0023B0171F|nr:zinc ABC transporter substrate-binding protein [Vibrio sp. JC009]WED20919.1 zinc ABC transporter substrate-binding protein [Vibrio sp. JC009]